MSPFFNNTAAQKILTEYESANMTLWKYSSVDGLITFTGKTFVRSVFGHNRDTYSILMSDFLRCHVHAEDHGEIPLPVDRTELSGKSLQYSCRIKNLETNGWIKVSSFGNPVRNKNGGVDFLGCFQQIIEDDCGNANSDSAMLTDAERISDITATTPYTCTIFDEKYRLIDCDSTAPQLFDLPNKKSYLDNFDKLSPEYQQCGKKSKECAIEKVKLAFEQGYQRFSWVHQKLDGTPIPSEVSLVKVQLGQRTVVVGHVRDLREFEDALEECRHANDKTQVMFDASPIGCNYVDAHFNVLDCNEAMPKLFGMSKQEYLDLYLNLFPPRQPNGKPSVEMYQEKMTAAFETGLQRFEWVYRAVDGQPIPVECTLVRVKQGGVNVVAEYVRDLREQKAMLAEIELAKDRTQLMLDAMPLCCTIVNGTTIIDCNAAAPKLFGLSNKEEYIERFWELTPPFQPNGQTSFEFARESFNRAIEKGVHVTEWVQIDTNNEFIPCELTLVRVRYANEDVVAIYARDLRENKAMLAAVQQANERTQIMLDATPISCAYWNDKFECIDCNYMTAQLFGLNDKREYIEQIDDMSPEFQPNGQQSHEYMKETVKEAYETGYVQIEWMHRHPQTGELIPTEKTIVRLRQGDSHILVTYTRDLRKEKKLLAEIEKAHAHTQILFDTTPLCCNLWTEEFQNIDCNEEAVRLFDLPDKQSYLARFFELSPEYQPSGRKTSDAALENLTKAFNEGYCRFEWMHQKLDGTPVPSEITLIRIKVGDSFLVAGYTRDLREQKAMLLQLQRATEREKVMLDSAPLACNLIDEDLKLVECNMEAPRLFGFANKEEYMANFGEILPEKQPCGRNSVELRDEYIRKTFETGYQRYEWLYMHANGEPIPAEITLVRAKDGESAGIIGYIRDLREIRKTQASLNMERDLLGRILESSPVCFAIVAGGTVERTTPFTKSFLGLDVGDCIADHFVDREQGEKDMQEMLLREDVYWKGVKIRAKSGEIFDMVFNALFVDYEGAQVSLIWLMDLTEYKKIERDLRVAKEVAESAVIVKSNFIANMSHEIRTPMNAVLGMLRLLAEANLADVYSRFVAQAETSAKLLLRILNDILDFSKLETGQMTLQPERIDIKAALVNIFESVSDEAKSKNLKLMCHINEDVPQFIVADQICLFRILSNLIGNAVKFTENGAVEVRISVSERTAECINLVFSVKDTGRGIAPKLMDTIFDAFMQCDGSVTRKYGGTGLGLAITKRTVEQLQGQIWCESTLGVGSCFYFTAPFGISTKTNGNNTVENRFIVSVDGQNFDFTHLQGLDVLLVEDNKVNQIVATGILKKTGVNVDVAENGIECLEKLPKKGYKIVFMDIQMPYMDGLEATRKIREMPQYADLPIIAVTAHAAELDREKSIFAGMNEHLTKPILPIAMYRALLRWI